VIQPSVSPAQNNLLGSAMQNNNNPLENSMRQSNILSTPSSKGGHDDDEYDK